MATTAPRVQCDFNKMLDEDVFSLSTLGTKRDLERIGLALTVGLELELYDLDEDETGECLLVADAEVVDIAPWGLVARVNPDSFRSEPRPAA
jgi:hypothetical protein